MGVTLNVPPLQIVVLMLPIVAFGLTVMVCIDLGPIQPVPSVSVAVASKTTLTGTAVVFTNV